MNTDKVLENIGGLDPGVHNPARLMLVYLLSRCDTMDYLDLMARTRLSSGNISTHLNKLAASGYIKIRKSYKGKKPHTSVSLTPAGHSAYANWGSMILAALPPSSIRQITAQRQNSLAEPPARFIHRDYSLLEGQFCFSMPEPLIRDFYLSPVQIPNCI